MLSLHRSRDGFSPFSNLFFPLKKTENIDAMGAAASKIKYFTNTQIKLNGGCCGWREH